MRLMRAFAWFYCLLRSSKSVLQLDLRIVWTSRNKNGYDCKVTSVYFERIWLTAVYAAGGARLPHDIKWHCYHPIDPKGRSLLVQEFFFRWNPLHEFFFSVKYCFFFNSEILTSLSMFLCFINYSTLTTDQRIQATLMQNLFENVHTVREEEATWSERLPCAFFQSLPSGIPLLEPIIMMPHSIHQNSKK